MLHALKLCLRPPRDATRFLEHTLDPDGAFLVTLSVRSALDALLTALALPTGSEVLLSAWTIPDIARILRGHGLVPVAMDCDDDTLAPTVREAESLVTERTRMVIVAQLFGAALDLAPWSAFAKRHSLVFLNDDAQGFTGPERLRANPDADVSFFSFGSIKTATALGGALTYVRDAGVRHRMRATMAAWPVQPTERYARKVSSFLGLVVPRDPARYARLAEALAWRGRDLDETIMGVTRGFPADTIDDLFRAIRWRPSEALVATLAHRFDRWDSTRLRHRRLVGETMRTKLGPAVTVLGRAMDARTHWLFAISVAAPAQLVERLRAEGFDAARGTSSLAPVSAEAVRCVGWSRGVVFLPVYPEVPDEALARMAGVVVSG